MRLIDADKLPTKHGVNVGANYGGLRAIVFRKDIDNAPTVDAEPVRHGWWTNISISANGIESSAECALCGAIVHNNFSSNINYCPNCGAYMGVEDGKTS